jgi:hypothetical protein
VSIRGGFIASELFQCPFERLSYKNVEPVDDLFNPAVPATVSRSGDYSKNIKSGGRVGCHTIHRNESVPDLPNLAKRFRNGRPAAINLLAIRSKDNYLWRPNCDNGCAVHCFTVNKTKQHAKKQAVNTEQPRWIRYRGSDSAWTWPDLNTGLTVYDPMPKDIDVSDDGKTWFHLVGRWCWDALPQIHLVWPSPAAEKQ